MKIAFAFFIAAASLSHARACERSLAGTWKSDRRATMQFVRENARLQKKTDAFLESLVGPERTSEHVERIL